MTLGGGDALARGAKSAQFSGGHSTVNDEVILNPSVVAPEDEMPNTQEVGITVVDKRRSYLDRLGEEKEIVEAQEIKEFPETEYEAFKPILDRVLVMRLVDPDVEVLEDGSAISKKTGLVIPAAYRQHTNTGIVLSTGSGVVTGGIRIPMDQIVKVGDRVYYGEYNAEMFPMKKEDIQKLCRLARVNYCDDGTGSLRLIRVQDTRGFERPVVK